ncbi:MAG: hypothetical protein IT349_04290, partial [Candidatus Eisenbacteria bacterium]|nr:hypothetical protein [Candidatus Eisenbacteria bacterium]
MTPSRQRPFRRSIRSAVFARPASPAAVAAAAAVTAALGIGLVQPPRAQAGRIHPALAAELSALALSDQASAILVLKEQVDLEALKSSLSARRANRREWHQEVVRALQAQARTSQAPLLAELEAGRRRGAIEGFTPYWIANLVVVRAERRALEALANRADV